MVDDLFIPINFPEPKTQADIDNAITKYPNFQRDYVWMGIRSKFRDEINKRWIATRQFCESNFVTELQSIEKFYSKLWELNLRYILLDKLVRSSGNGEPDLIGSKFVIECVVPAPVDVPELRLDGKMYNFPTDEINRRITTALNSKHQQLVRRLGKKQSRIDYSKIPYVIAINLPESNYMGAGGKTGMNMIEEILMGAKELQVKVNLNTKRAITSIAPLASIQSKQGSPIEVGYFQRDSWKPVSAVIWSTHYLPDKDEVNIVLNPNASIPLNPKDISEIHRVITYTKTPTGYDRDQKLS